MPGAPRHFLGAPRLIRGWKRCRGKGPQSQLLMGHKSRCVLGAAASAGDPAPWLAGQLLMGTCCPGIVASRAPFAPTVQSWPCQPPYPPSPTRGPGGSIEVRLRLGSWRVNALAPGFFYNCLLLVALVNTEMFRSMLGLGFLKLSHEGLE